MRRVSPSPFLKYSLIITLVGSIFSTGLMIQTSYGSHSDITVELDDDIYGQSDSVTITGTVDGADNNDPVDITIHKAGGGTDNADTDIDGDDGDFSSVYEIDDNADDGVYQVEVEFGTEDPVSTFFIVDEDNDNVSVATDNSYDPGDDVIIEGDVDDTVTGVEEVEITVIASDGEEILSSKNADLDTNDHFEDDSLTLDDNAPHGIYAVKVEYDGEEAGWTLFEVTENGGGTHQITATLSKSSYRPGETVTLDGSVDEDDVDLIEAFILVEDPVGTNVYDDSTRPDTDGTFDFSFDLDDNADEGTYDVTLSYEDYDDKVIHFTVSESSTGGGGTSGLTAKLNKSSYLAGEAITVTGVVPRIVDEPISITVLEPDGTFAGSAAYPDPDSDKSYSATLRLKADLDEDEDYRLVVSYDDKEVIVKFDITGKADESTGGAVTVKTDKPTYSSGSTVLLSGKVSPDLLTEDKQLAIQVFNPDKAAYRFEPITPSSDGSYIYSMQVGGPLAVSGEWEVVVTYSPNQAKTTFALTGGAASTGFKLNAGGQTYTIPYEVSGGSVKSMYAKPTENKLVVVMNADQSGTLTITLPREVIDAIQGSSDIKYIVSASDVDTGSSNILEVTEKPPTNESRILVIDYASGTDLIEIQGTTVVPEFGALSVVILAIAIVGMVIVTARYSGKFSLSRK